MRRERPHPGAQVSFTDHDGYRFQTILTDQTDQDIAIIECRHRQPAHVEDRIRDDKDTGLSKFPLKEFALNEVWLEIVMLAHDLIVWTQALVLDGELAKAEPKRLHLHGRRGGTSGYSGDGGTAAAAEFGQSETVAVSSSGGLYIADFDCNCNRKVVAQQRLR